MDKKIKMIIKEVEKKMNDASEKLAEAMENLDSSIHYWEGREKGLLVALKILEKHIN